ncbi:unnamed protein product [Discosporangium mesarthrocarpum]
MIIRFGVMIPFIAGGAVLVPLGAVLLFNVLAAKLAIVLGYLEDPEVPEHPRKGVMGYLSRTPGLRWLAAGESVSISFYLQPICVRCRGVVLSPKTLSIISAVLVGVLPIRLIAVHIDEIDIVLEWGILGLIGALWNGRREGNLAPRTSVKLKNVLALAERTTEDDWKEHEDVLRGFFVGESRYIADLLTSLVDGSFWDVGEPQILARRVDSFLNKLSVHLEFVHLRIRDDTNGGTPGKSDASVDSGNLTGKVLGLRVAALEIDRGEPSEDTSGATPRTLNVNALDLYHDLAVPRPCRLADAIEASADEEWRNNPREPPTHPIPKDYEDHASVLFLGSAVLTLVLPDILCVMLTHGKRPSGKGKLLRVQLTKAKGIRLRLDADQMSSLLNDALNIVTGAGPQFEWLERVRGRWNEEQHAFRLSPEESRAYAEALGPKGGKRDNAVLGKLEGNMSLAYIMLERMRARGWNPPRPASIMTEANWVLQRLDPMIPGFSLGEGYPPRRWGWTPWFLTCRGNSRWRQGIGGRPTPAPRPCAAGPGFG